ncbi:MAG: hypothetical protein V4436_02065 [Patescibacteria group bacterium]
MKINKKALDATQLEYLATAEALQAELLQNGFMASRVIKGEDRTDFKVVYFDGAHDYNVKRDWHGNVYITRAEYQAYPNVSHTTRFEVVKKHINALGNMKVITAKKLQAKIDAENAYHAEMAGLNAEAGSKAFAFVEEVKALEAQGVPVHWQRERDTGKITGGELERNGIEFIFEISQDGYISKNLEVSYKPDNTLENFMLLSDNKYTV